jgi:hypothetical protein
MGRPRLREEGEGHNITLTLSRDVTVLARALAATERGSVSQLVENLLSREIHARLPAEKAAEIVRAHHAASKGKASAKKEAIASLP